MRAMKFALLMLTAADQTKRSLQGKLSCSEQTESFCTSCKSRIEMLTLLIYRPRATQTIQLRHPQKISPVAPSTISEPLNHLHPNNIPLSLRPPLRRRPTHHLQTKWPAQRTRPRSSACRLRRNPSRKSSCRRVNRPSPRYGYIRYHGARPHPRSPTPSRPSV